MRDNNSEIFRGARGETHHSRVLGFNEGPVGAVHLVVEAARVAQVVARPVPPPEGRGRGAAVDALPAQLATPPAHAEGAELLPAHEAEAGGGVRLVPTWGRGW